MCNVCNVCNASSLRASLSFPKKSRQVAIGVGVTELCRVALPGLFVDASVHILVPAGAAAVSAGEPITMNYTHNQFPPCPPDR